MQHINYQRVFNAPYRLYTPYGTLSITTILLFIIILVLYNLLLIYLPFVNYFVTYIAHCLPGGVLYLYVGIPYLLCLFICKIDRQGKKIHIYLLDYVRWHLYIKKSNYVYGSNEKVKYMHSHIVFR